MQNKNLSDETDQKSEALKFTKGNAFPFVKAGTGLIAAAFILYIILHQVFISLGLALLGFVLLGANALVSKSLELTSQSSQSHQSLDKKSILSVLENSKRQIVKTKYYEKLETEGEALSHQAEALLSQYKTLSRLIEQKFDRGELTFSRYQEAVEKACLGIGENLIFLKNILDQLNIDRMNSNWELQRQDFLKASTKSQESLMQLTQLFQSLNSIVTQEQYRGQLDEYLEQLKQLSERSKLYSKGNN